MKRGLIRWDREALPPSVFDQRLARARKALADRDLPALIVYSDVARSAEARHLTNFMPYWNRSLAVIPRDSAPVLLCALSPRVYPWIRSVTVFEEIRPASKMIPSLAQLCEERGWKRVGVLDLSRMIGEFQLPVDAVDVPSAAVIETDAAELAMHRTAAVRARRVLEEHLPNGRNRRDYELVGALEREFRRAGAEDLVIRISSGSTPGPATGAILGERYSVAVALEYCGHWARVTRPSVEADSLRQQFFVSLKEGRGQIERLFGSIHSLHVMSEGLYYGDTCYGPEIL